MKNYALYTILLFLFISCGSGRPPFYVDFTPTAEEKKYFQEIALGAEFGDGEGMIKKWNRDIKIWLTGEKRPKLEKELDNIIEEINDLIPVIQLSRVKNEADANFKILFGKGKDYVEQLESEAKNQVENNWGLFWVYWNNGSITEGSMYVDVFRAEEEDAQKHLLREELTQALGLLNDSYEYDNSIFQQRWTTTTTYDPIDIKVIQLLYDSRFRAGMKPERVEEILESIE